MSAAAGARVRVPARTDPPPSQLAAATTELVALRAAVAEKQSTNEHLTRCVDALTLQVATYSGSIAAKHCLEAADRSAEAADARR